MSSRQILLLTTFIVLSACISTNNKPNDPISGEIDYQVISHGNSPRYTSNHQLSTPPRSTSGSRSSNIHSPIQDINSPSSSDIHAPETSSQKFDRMLKATQNKLASDPKIDTHSSQNPKPLISGMPKSRSLGDLATEWTSSSNQKQQSHASEPSRKHPKKPKSRSTSTSPKPNKIYALDANEVIPPASPSKDRSISPRTMEQLIKVLQPFIQNSSFKNMPIQQLQKLLQTIATSSPSIPPIQSSYIQSSSIVSPQIPSVPSEKYSQPQFRTPERTPNTNNPIDTPLVTLLQPQNGKHKDPGTPPLRVSMVDSHVSSMLSNADDLGDLDGLLAHSSTDSIRSQTSRPGSAEPITRSLFGHPFAGTTDSIRTRLNPVIRPQSRNSDAYQQMESYQSTKTIPAGPYNLPQLNLNSPVNENVAPQSWSPKTRRSQRSTARSTRQHPWSSNDPLSAVLMSQNQRFSMNQPSSLYNSQSFSLSNMHLSRHGSPESFKTFHTSSNPHMINQNISLFHKYWWVMAIISCVIVMLFSISCILMIKQYKHSKNQKGLRLDEKLDIYTTPKVPKSKKSKLKAKEKEKVKVNKKKYRVQIETTMSDQAPAKSWMICDTIGSGRFGDVRLAINPNVKYKKDAQYGQLDDAIPSCTRSYATMYSPSTSDVFHAHPAENNNVIIEPKFWAVKRAKFLRKDMNEAPMAGTEVFSIFHEILILSKLKHPNIVKYYGNGVANEHICLFLEWCPVGSMADILAVRKSFSIPRIHHYLLQLLNAVDYLHSQQIFHRDIKARNILLGADGVCKLADFGAAVDILDNSTADDFCCAAGTIHWWPPETFLSQEEKHEVLAAHDVWSLGVTAIEMVNEVPLFYQLSVEVFSAMMKNTPHHYLEQLPITLDSNLNMFIHGCLNVNWRQRPSIKQLLQSAFILHGPKYRNSNSTGMSSYLSNRENEAQIHANSIINANLQLWMNVGMNLEDSASRTPPSSKTDTWSERSLYKVNGGLLLLQQQGIDPENYRKNLQLHKQQIHFKMHPISPQNNTFSV